ncbi:AMP-binding enzyme domain-containing protein [Cladophialophora immunda]|nr:AMP-binding enzyme domain-containing protein [Cladophialophora immunda]
MSLSQHHPTDAVDPVWTAPKSIQIPSTDILTFAFANLSQYDNSCPIFIDASNPSNRISAQQARRTILQLTHGLRALGLKDGECVCLHAFNNIWYPLIWLAIIGSGARVVGSNPKYTKDELIHLLSLTKPKVVFAQVDCIEPIAEAVAHCGAESQIFTIESHDASHQARGRAYASWRALLLEPDGDWYARTANRKPDPECIAVYAMTSGTTGLPKAAMISHRYIVALTSTLEDVFRSRPYRPSQLICLPVFHAFASPLALILPLRLGVPTFFLPKWSLSEYLQAIQTYAITDTPVSPPIIGALTRLPASDMPILQSLRYVISAGAALPASVQNKLYDVLAQDAVITQCWGTTEAGWHSLGSWEEKDSSGSVGQLLPNTQMKLVDEDGNVIVQEGKAGEALIKTPTLFSGYLANPDANRDSFDSDGFYRTGDRIEVREGRLHYCDRIKETLKVKGWQVSPSEIESVLIQHPQIADVAIGGDMRENEDGLLETFPTAYVVRSPGSSEPPLAEQDVKEFVACRLISYKQITGGVIFVTQIPRTPSGKIIRRNLPEAERDLSSENPVPKSEEEEGANYH